jgi:6-phosphofructokinase 1
MAVKSGRIGILVGGGPAPGINSVIAAATIRAILRGYEVMAIHGGFKWIMRGDTSDVEPLTIERVSRIHFRGGSELGTHRDNPTIDNKLMDNTLESLRRIGVNRLITIGGDDTAFSAHKLIEHSKGTLRAVHVPKTIDNDLDLPHGADTFGYQTARHLGVDLVKNMMIDAKSTGRWFLIISMGRKAGHLALGIGKAAGATMTIVPEEFASREIRLSHVADILAGGIIKRLAQNRRDGVAIIAEGVMERLRPGDFEALDNVARDQHGHIRLGELHFAPVLKQKLIERLAQFRIKVPITTKDIGYELRCASPIPYDMEYTRDLGFCAAQFLINGGTAAMVSIENGRFRPLKFTELMDPETGRIRVRMIPIESEYYGIARRYMIRLHRTDFDSEEEIARFGRVCGISPEEFRNEFGYLIDQDSLYRLRDEKRKKKPSPEDVLWLFR